MTFGPNLYTSKQKKCIWITFRTRIEFNLHSCTVMSVGGVSAQIISSAGRSSSSNRRMRCFSPTGPASSRVAAGDHWLTIILSNLPLCLLLAKQNWGWSLNWLWANREQRAGTVALITALVPPLVAQHRSRREFWLANRDPFCSPLLPWQQQSWIWHLRAVTTAWKKKRSFLAAFFSPPTWTTIVDRPFLREAPCEGSLCFFYLFSFIFFIRQNDMIKQMLKGSFFFFLLFSESQHHYFTTEISRDPPLPNSDWSSTPCLSLYSSFAQLNILRFLVPSFNYPLNH